MSHLDLYYVVQIGVVYFLLNKRIAFNRRKRKF